MEIENTSDSTSDYDVDFKIEENVAAFRKRKLEAKQSEIKRIREERKQISSAASKNY